MLASPLRHLSRTLRTTTGSSLLATGRPAHNQFSSRMSATSAKPMLHQLLTEFGTDRYHILYGGFKNNHVAHGIIALERLGATRSRILQYVNQYILALEEPAEFEKSLPKSLCEEPTAGQQRLSDSTLESLRGARRSFYPLLHHYEELLDKEYDGCTDRLIEGEWPRLYSGLICSALHGLIHLGYGFNVRDSRMVCEGMANIHHCYIPLCRLSENASAFGSLGTGQTDILDVLAAIREDIPLTDFMLEKIDTEEWKNRDIGFFQTRVGVLFTHRGDELSQYVGRIKLPPFINLKNLADRSEVEKLMKWTVDCAIIVYVLSLKNDFFLLHGVTSAFSLRSVLSVVTNTDCVLRSVQVFLCALLATYVAQNSLLLDRAILVSDASNIPSWEELRELTLAGEEKDEHIYKLVQVCQDMAVQFKDRDMDVVYRRASSMAINLPLTNGGKPF